MPPTLCSDSPDSISVVKPGVSTIDGCELFAKSKAFVVDGGACSTLEWTFRDHNGNPIDLTACFSDSASASLSVSGSAVGDLYRVELRIARALKLNPSIPPLVVYGVIIDPAKGVVQAVLPASVARSAGIYQLSWAIVNNANNGALTIDQGLLSVERSLFTEGFGVSGPPTLQEIRLELRDTEASMNRLLQDVEYDDSEILRAIVKPVEEWNNTPPSLSGYVYDTHTFPYRHFWMQGIKGYLLSFAAQWYRRNKMPYSAGGVSIDDLNKDREYLEGANLLLIEYKTWVRSKKYELNSYGAYGEVSSSYSGRGIY